MSQSLTWSIKDFYKKSWSLTLKHKKLWIIALALAVGSGGSGGGGGSSKTPESPKEQVERVQNTSLMLESELTPLAEQITKNPTDLEKNTIGSVEKYTEASGPVKFPKMDKAILNTLGDIKSGLPLFATIFLVIQLVALFVWAIVFSLVLKSWSTAALIIGVHDADRTDKVDLTQISHKALSRIKPISWVLVVPGLFFVLSFFAAFIAFLIAFLILKDFAPILVILTIIAVIACIYILITLMLTTIWAIRYVALENKDGKQAFKLGHKTIKGNIGKMLSLGFANALSSGLAGLVVLIPFGSIGLAAAIPAIQAQKFTLDLAITLVILFLAMIPTLSLTNAAMNVFRFATWNYGFDLVKKDTK